MSGPLQFKLSEYNNNGRQYERTGRNAMARTAKRSLKPIGFPSRFSSDTEKNMQSMNWNYWQLYGD